VTEGSSRSGATEDENRTWVFRYRVACAVDVEWAVALGVADEVEKQVRALVQVESLRSPVPGGGGGGTGGGAG